MPQVFAFFLTLIGMLTAPLAFGQVPLHEGQSVWAAQVVKAQQGTLLARVKGSEWDPEKLGEYGIWSVGGKGFGFSLDAAGLSIDWGRTRKRLKLPRRNDPLEHLLAVRWNDARMELWLDARPIESVEKEPFKVLVGNLAVAAPTRDNAPYRILSVQAFPARLNDSDMALTFHLLGFSNAPLATIPLTDTPPKIDGVRSDREWSRATLLRGFHERNGRFLAKTPSSAQLMYDQKNLYVCYQGSIPPQARKSILGRTEQGKAAARGGAPVAQLLVRQAPRWAEGKEDAEDLFRLTLAPPEWSGGRLRLATNHGNRHRAWRIRADGGEAPEANGLPWESRTSISREGWCVEAAIPFRSLGLAPPQAGAVWGANVSRRWVQLQSQWDGWAVGARLRGKPAPAGAGLQLLPLGRIRFGGQEDVVIRLEKLGLLRFGRPDIQLALSNPGSRPAQVRVSLRSNDGAFAESKGFKLKPGGKEIFQFHGKDAPRYSIFLHLAVTRDGSHQPLFVDTFSYRQETGPACSLRHYPSLERLELEWDLSLYGRYPLKDLLVQIQLVDPKTNQTALTRVLAGFEDAFPKLSLSTKNLPEARYLVVSRVGYQKREVGHSVIGWQKRSRPEWLGNSLGRSDYVPPPFQPVQAEGLEGVASRKIKALDRVYEFGRAALPVQIYVRGIPLLAGPIRLISVRPNGKKRDLARDLVWGRGGGNPILVDPASFHLTRVEWQSTSGSAEKIEPSISGWAEFDGLLWFAVRVAGEHWTKLSSLRLEIPFRKEAASLVYGLGNVREAVPAGNASVNGPPRPIWVGNEKSGLQWIIESCASWRLNDFARAIQLIPQQDRVLMTIGLVDHEVELTGGLVAEFGLQTSVGKPVRKTLDLGHQTLDQPLRRPNSIRRLANKKPNDSASNDFAILLNSDPPVLDLSWFQVDASPAGRSERQILDEFFYEWSASRATKWRTGLRFIEVCPGSRSWQDYVLWRLDRRFEKEPFSVLRVRGLEPIISDNRYAGGGARHGGHVFPQPSILSTRELLTRVYRFLKERMPGGRLVLERTRGQWLAPLDGFDGGD